MTGMRSPFRAPARRRSTAPIALRDVARQQVSAKSNITARIGRTIRNGNTVRTGPVLRSGEALEQHPEKRSRDRKLRTASPACHAGNRVTVPTRWQDVSQSRLPRNVHCNPVASPNTTMQQFHDSGKLCRVLDCKAIVQIVVRPGRPTVVCRNAGFGASLRSGTMLAKTLHHFQSSIPGSRAGACRPEDA